MHIWRVSTLQWIAGAFAALIGSLMLVAPHQFAYLRQVDPRLNPPLWGIAFILAGVAMFAIIVMRPRRNWIIVYHWFTGLLLVALAASFALTRGWVSALNYSVMGVGLILAAYLPLSRPAVRLHASTRPRRAARPDLFVFLMGLSALLTGLVMLALTEQSANPVYNLIPLVLLFHGAAFTILGGLLAAAQLSTAFLFKAQAPAAAPRVIRVLANLVRAPFDRWFYLLVALFFLLFIFEAALPNRLWLAAAFYGAFGLALAGLPWILPFAHRVQPSALRSQLALVLAVAMAVPLIFTVALVTHQQERDFKKDILNWQRDQVHLQANAIADYLEAYQAAVHALIHQPGLMHSSPAEQRAVINAFARGYAQAAAVSLYDAEGRLLATSPGSQSPVSVAALPMFEVARRTGAMTREIVPSVENRPARIRLGAPVLDEQGVFLGLAYISLYTEDLAGPIFQPGRDPQTVFYLIDDTGRLVVYSAQELSGSLSDFSAQQPVRAVLQAEPASGSLTYLDAGGEERWVAYARMPDPAWSVIIDTTSTHALAPVYAGRNLAYGILLVSLLGAALAGVALARALTRPLGALLQAVHNLTEGDDSLNPLPASSIPEVSRLAAAFSLLRARLAERTAEREQAEEELHQINLQLEQRVAERTYQVELANARLQQELSERQRAEAALGQREKEIRTLVENAPDGIIRYDSSMHPVFFSPAGKRIAEWIEQALVNPGENESAVSQALLSVEKTLLGRVFRSGEEAVLEFSIPTPDGPRYFETRYVPEFTAEGGVASILAIWRDLTGRRLVEEALRANEERLRISLSHAGIWVFSLNCELRYTWVYNPPPQIRDRVLTQKSDHEVFGAEDAAHLIELKRSVLRRGEGARQEVVLHLAGQSITYDMVLEPLRGENGEINGLIGSAIDITEHNALLHKTEQQQILLEEQNQLLRSRKELLETIFEVDPGGIAVVVGDRLEFQFANPAYRALTPYPDLEPVGRMYSEIWPPSENFRGAWLLHRILETGKPLQLDWYPQEFPGGELRYFSFNVRRIPWGGEMGLLLTMWDTTSMEEAYQRAEQAATEARLRADEAEVGRRLLQNLMQYIPEGIAIADLPEALIRMVSLKGQELLSDQNPRGEGLPTWMQDIPVAEHLRYWQLYHLDQVTPATLEDTPLWRAIQQGEIVLNEEWLLGAPGRRQIFVLCSAAPLRDEEDEVVGALFSWRDITERKRAEAALESYARQLERSNQELQDFAFIASHDLQEPLRKIQAFGDRLKEHSADSLDENSLDFLNRMQSASQRMRSMIDDLLALSRVTTRGRPFTTVSLNQVARDVISDLEIRIERSNARVQVDDLPELEADPSQIRQLFQNLIANALKFHKPGEPPQIQIGARPDPGSPGKRVQILVNDQGIGFSLDYLDRIFQPFQRLHGRSQYEGMGMGLAICNRIVERHNGEITAESAPGQGATFIVTLPLRQESPHDEK